MKRIVRLSVIGFAVCSTLFWMTVFTLRNLVIGVRAMAYGAEPTMAQHWLFGTLPAVLSGVICWVFLNWFARRIFKLARAQ